MRPLIVPARDPTGALLDAVVRPRHLDRPRPLHRSTLPDGRRRRGARRAPEGAHGRRRPGGQLPRRRSRVCVRLHLYTGEAPYRERAEAALACVGPLLERAPQAFGRALGALALLRNGPVEVAVVGPGRRPLLDVLDGRYRPGLVVAAGDTTGLLVGRTAVEGRAAAYVCRGFACQTPVTEPGALEAALRPAP